MTVRVKVKDFQSIREADVEIEGFTVITGKNNSGKTALQRAIKGVFENTPGNSYIRKGTEETSVEILFEEGKTVKWTKGRRPSYELNGGEPIYPGQGVPDELEAYGVHPIQAGGRTVWPTVADQFTGQVFLLDQPGSVLAEAVADVERVGQLNGALSASESDRRSVSATLKVREKDLKNAEEKANFYAGLENVVDLYEGLEEQHFECVQLGGELKAVDGLLREYGEAYSSVQHLSGCGDVPVPASEDVARIQKIDKALAYLGSLQQDLLESQSVCDALTGIGQVDVPEGAGELRIARELEGMQELANAYKEAERRWEGLSGVSKVGVPEVVSVQGLSESLTSIKALYDEYLQVVEAYEKLSSVGRVSVPDVGGVERVEKALGFLIGLQRDLDTFQDEIMRHQQQLESTTENLSQVRGEIQTLLESEGDCPTCGQMVQKKVV